MTLMLSLLTDDIVHRVRHWQGAMGPRGARAPHFYKWLGTGGTVSRRTANKKLTKLY